MLSEGGAGEIMGSLLVILLLTLALLVILLLILARRAKERERTAEALRVREMELAILKPRMAPAMFDRVNETSTDPRGVAKLHRLKSD